MPWKESCHVNERMHFIARFQSGERMSDLCQEFGISRKTGYKFLDRFKKLGLVGLYDQAPVAQRIPHRTAPEVVELLVQARRAHPSWGPRKLRAWLLQKDPTLRLPAASTIGDWLKRRGVVATRRRRQSVPASVVGRSTATAPNELWCADFKGQFRLGNRSYCYPLTISDAHSRYLLECAALESTKGGPARSVFEVAFREHGLPQRIRTDNGSPFASRGLAGLSRLSVWWLKLGIVHERIEPGHPEQNGQHERMHRTLKAETTRPAAACFLQQQERFDAFMRLYNDERPHEALGQRPPLSRYQISARNYPEHLPDPQYPLEDDVRRVTLCGHLQLPGRLRTGRQIYLSTALAGELVGVRELDSHLWRVAFTSLQLGIFDVRTGERIAAPTFKEEIASPPS